MTDIIFEMNDNLHVRIDTENYEYLKDVEKLLTEYKNGYQWTPLFKQGFWNGRISLFKKPKRTFPYGLLSKVLRHLKEDWPNLTYYASPEVRNLFRGVATDEIRYNLNLIPYDYQKKAIETSLAKAKCICVLPTASGKSLVIAYIIKHINEVTDNNKSLIIVPTLSLVDQFVGDLTDYGYDPNIIGKVNADFKEFKKQVVVSTWQSLQNQLDMLDMFDTVIVDEVHSCRADKLTEIMKTCERAKFRIGMTGTMPTHPLEYMNVVSYIGPELVRYTSKDLANLGYISHCTVKMLKVEYEDDLNEKKNDYTIVRDKVFPNPYRLGLIKHLVKNTDNSVLILIEKVEKEGALLEEILKEAFPKRKVLFLSGKDETLIRECTRKEMNERDDMVVIATYPLFQQGVNIKSLRTMILASSTKSFIRVIQSLGRTLRKHVSKELGGAELYDICDGVKFLRDHADKRERHYIKEGHEIEVIELTEASGRYEL